jgi:hypothetical protein
VLFLIEKRAVVGESLGNRDTRLLTTPAFLKIKVPAFAFKLALLFTIARKTGVRTRGRSVIPSRHVVSPVSGGRYAEKPCIAIPEQVGDGMRLN